MRTYKDLAVAEDEGRLKAALNENSNILVEAPTGSGKSLYIPWFLSRNCSGRVVVLQPRRIAALSLARYSAQLHGETCGKTIGYQFRQESCKSSDTRILFQTYGNFLQELLHGKMDAEWIVFDEYHERKADMDLLMSYMLQLQSLSEKSPRIAVMSAKLNREELERTLGTKCLELGHPLYPVQIINQNPMAGNTLEAEVVRALRTLYMNKIWQTTLVFLPGKTEISKCHNTAEMALGTQAAEFYDLFGGQDRAIQDQIFEETERPRIIFTTNIAETSITVPNVSGVIDSGIERTSLYDDSEGVCSLRTVSISMQNAIQRSGRSGRTQNGCAIRLWNKEAEQRMAKGIVPEVTQIELSEFLLQKAALEKNLEKFCPSASRAYLKLPTAPPNLRENQALAVLKRLGLITETENQNQITELGLAAIKAPISHITLAYILASAKKVDDLPDALLSAMAWIHSGTDFIQKSKNPINLIAIVNDSLSKNITIPKEVEFTFRQLLEYRKEHFSESVNQVDPKTIIKQLLNAFLDKLATPSGDAYKLQNQNIIRLQVADSPYALLALNMLRTYSQTKSELRVNLYVPIAKELLESEKTITRYELLWRVKQERFIGVEIQEDENTHKELSRREILTQEASPKVLTELKKLTVDAWRDKLEKENWTGRYMTDATQTLLIKMRLAAKLYPEYSLPEFNSEDMELIFDEFTDGVFLLRDITEERYQNILEDYFGRQMLGWLSKTFPDHYLLPNGKKARYTYTTNDDEILIEISARIEDFMDLRGEHHIADGKIKVRYDILAPNFRTIQKTCDLTGFWKNTYPEIRKELRGRYPKHPWPETIQ
ncbi:MAG: DEAD/DEAH box helicase [Fibrobacter sp.]|nr:DEAD/DEAH box helicase [Fibrobacter sp.]